MPPRVGYVLEYGMSPCPDDLRKLEQRLETGLMDMGLLHRCSKPGCKHDRWCKGCHSCFFHCKRKCP